MIAAQRFKRIHIQLAPAISTGMLRQAKLFWIKYTQQIEFKEEIKMIQNSLLPHSHSLNRQTPFLDADGVLRLGGRLNHTNLNYSIKHPAILSRHTPLTALIVHQAHLDTFHGGIQLTLAEIRQEYGIIGGRATVKSHIVHGVICT